MLVHATILGIYSVGPSYVYMYSVHTQYDALKPLDKIVTPCTIMAVSDCVVVDLYSTHSSFLLAAMGDFELRFEVPKLCILLTISISLTHCLDLL